MSESNLFEGTVIYVIGNVEQKVLDILKNGKANITMFSKDSATHFIVGKSFDESQVLEAKELYEKPAVTEQWVVNSLKLGKLLPSKAYDPLPSGKFFQNCIFTMYQIDPQDRLKLYSMITFYGGAVQKELDNKVTHLISGGPQSVAIKVAALTKNKLTIITPDWVQQCLKQKRLVEAENYHPSMLSSSTQPQSKITLMPSSISGDKTQIIRGALQPNIRLSRPVVQQMQHTPQQINEIIQSQIQQQQLQEKAKQRAAAAAAHGGSTITVQTTPPPQQQQQHQQTQSIQIQQSPQQTTPNQPNMSNLLPQNASVNVEQNQQIIQQNIPTVVQQITATTQQSQVPPQNINVNQVNPSQQNINQQIIQQQQQQKLIQQQQQMITTNIQQQPNVQNIQGPQMIQQQVQINPGQQQNVQQQNMQRQISMQQIDRAKIQLISQQLQQSTANQQIIAQQQQFKQYQNQQIIGQNQQPQTVTHIPQNVQQNQQQFVKQNLPQAQHIQGNVIAQQQQANVVQQPQQGNVVQAQGGNIIQQGGNLPQQNVNLVQQQFTSPMKQIINPNNLQGQQIQQQMAGQQIQQSPQQQQFMINQGNVKTVQGGTPQQGQQGGGNNFIQIIQQGQNQQIIQIQNPDGTQMQQKVINQTIHPNQQNQPQMQNVQNVITNINQSSPQNVQIAQQQQQTTNQQQNIIQNQNNRQNIVIINQVQNSQQMNSLAIQNQRFQNANQMKPQQQQVPGQQIIQQKIISTSDQIVQAPTGNVTTQSNPQIIQVHQSPISGPASVQQQNLNDQVAPNQAMTQAQAVQQIAQQLQSGSAEIISNTMNQQQMTAAPMNQPMNIISQSPVQQQNVGNQSPQIAQSPQWIPQSPTQQPPQSPVVQHHIITTNQGTAQIAGGQFIRATGNRMDTHIYLDAQSSAQFAKMDQSQKKEYLEKLHIQQQQQQQRGVMFQQRPNAPNIIAGGRPQHHIVIRSQMPQGLTQQQQMQWIQQNQRRQFVIRPGGPGGQQIPGQPGQSVAQFSVDPNATPQQQQIIQRQQQQNFQRLQQIQQSQKMQQGQQTPNSPRGPGFVANEPMDGIQIPIDPSNKTKTALANMLSNRLGNNGNVTQIVDQPEQSAAGTLRMMTAQHNAALSVPGIPPGVVRTPQEMIVLQQQQQQLQPQIVGGQQIIQGHPQMQQRRQLTNITNAGGKPQVIVTNPIPSGAQVMISQSPNPNMKSPVAFSPGRAPAITNRAQFYGHNPNLKLPADLFLLGCHFLIVEYTETNADELPEWKQTIKNHGGEIESCYNARVTHVLCRTQKHGIVMQAIRDNKRCVTVYWLNDMILNKTVAPPWQAIHLPSPGIFGNMKPGSKHIITIMGFEGDERERVKRMIEESGAKLTTYMNRQNTVVVCKKLDQTHKKYLHAKEFNIPMVNLVWLGDLLLGNTSAISQFDSPKYQQYNLPQPLKIDPSIVIQLMNAWKAPINLTQESHERLKRSQLDPTPQKTKKIRTIPFLETISDEINCIRQPEPNNIPIVMFSQIDNSDGLIRAVTALGGRVTTDINEMTHLVMTKPTRTIKFLQALCNAKYIVKSTWIEESTKAGFFQTEDNFWVNELEGNFKCNIPAVVMSPTRKTLFQNRVFFITPSVVPGPSFLKWMIEQCGGKWEQNRRSIMKIHEINQQSPNSYIIISCPEDLHLLNFKHFVCYVCTSEFILQSIMTQTIDFLRSELQLTR